jgi:hypothetical protein
LITNKYLRDRSITQVTKRTGDSQFWKGLMNSKDQFLEFGNFRLENEAKLGYGKTNGWLIIP